MRKQNAIYWPPAGVDDFGRASHGTLQELILKDGVNSRVRWEDRVEEFKDANGTMQISNAMVYVGLLPDGNEAQVGGFVWLGNRADLTDEANPVNNEGAYEVRRVDKMPNLKATEYLRTAYL
jgi:hypothetical protein